LRNLRSFYDQHIFHCCGTKVNTELASPMTSDGNRRQAMRSLSTTEVNNVSGGGCGGGSLLGLGILADLKVVLQPLLKVSIGAGIGVTAGGSSGHCGHC
jgi:hypothetical protein